MSEIYEETLEEVAHDLRIDKDRLRAEFEGWLNRSPGAGPPPTYPGACYALYQRLSRPTPAVGRGGTRVIQLELSDSEAQALSEALDAELLGSAWRLEEDYAAFIEAIAGRLQSQIADEELRREIEAASTVVDRRDTVEP